MRDHGPARGAIRGKPMKATMQRQGRAVSARSGQPPDPRAGVKHALGVGLHLCRHVVRLRLCGLRDRCLRPPSLGLAGKRTRYTPELRARCPRSRGLHDRAARPAEADLIHQSDRGSRYVSIKYYREPRRGWDQTIGRQRWRQLRQCLGRDDQRSLQGRYHPPARSLAII
jgi:hypothetical protein